MTRLCETRHKYAGARLDSKQVRDAITESKKLLKESDSDVYNAWLMELNDLCEDVNEDCKDRDALFFGKASFPNVYVKGRKLDQMVKDGEAEDLSTAFAMIVDSYTNANFTYNLVDDDEEHYEIEISIGGQIGTLDENRKKKFKNTPMTEAFEAIYSGKEAFHESIDDEFLGKSEDKYYSLYRR